MDINERISIAGELRKTHRAKFGCYQASRGITGIFIATGEIVSNDRDEIIKNTYQVIARKLTFLQFRKFLREVANV